MRNRVDQPAQTVTCGCIKQYGGKISFMGALHSGEIDFPAWAPENCAKHVEDACKSFEALLHPAFNLGLGDELIPGRVRHSH